jgi:hypothetical protein
MKGIRMKIAGVQLEYNSQTAMYLARQFLHILQLFFFIPAARGSLSAMFEWSGKDYNDRMLFTCDCFRCCSGRSTEKKASRNILWVK